MPLLVKCSRCKHLIYYTDSLEGLEDLQKIFETISKCPSCGKEIRGNIEVKNIEVKP